ncbi:MAG: hypothetical protein ABI716_01060 [Candidatus Saccharibacteria bacterium]
MNPDDPTQTNTASPSVELPPIPPAEAAPNMIDPTAAGIPGFIQPAVPQPPHQVEPSAVQAYSLWRFSIQWINLVFMILALAALLAIDLPLVLGSSSTLLQFFYAMLYCFGILVVFSALEFFVFRKKFSQSRSNFDAALLGLVVTRNVFLLLSVIPLIQLIGLLALGILGLPFLAIYIVLIILRWNRSTPLI